MSATMRAAVVTRFGEHLDLLLLQHDADQPIALTRLDEEGALAGLTHRPGDEAVGELEAVLDRRHGTTLGRAPQPSPAPQGFSLPVPPPSWGPCPAGAWGRRRVTWPSVVLIAITIGAPAPLPSPDG